MRQRHLRLRLLEEHPQQARALADPRQHALDDQLLLEPLGAGVAREEHLGHAALPDRAQEVVAAETGAHDGHDTVVVRACDRSPLAGRLRLLCGRAGRVRRATRKPPSPSTGSRRRRHRSRARSRARRSATAAKSMGARFVDAGPAEPVVPSLVPALEAAKSAYARVRVPRRHRRARCAAARRRRGGRRPISTAVSCRRSFSIAASRSSRPCPPTPPWDDLVNAARLEPTRVLDPARFPPRAVAAYKRAAAEAALLPRAELILDVPPDAVVRVDGVRSPPAAALTLGQHFVSVAADGYERWAAVDPRVGRSDPIQAPDPPSSPAAGRQARRARRRVPNRTACWSGRWRGRPSGWTLHGPRHHAVRRPLGQRLGHARRRADARGGRRARAPRPSAPPPNRADAGCRGCIGACAAVLTGVRDRDSRPRATRRRTSVGELGSWR